MQQESPTSDLSSSLLSHPWPVTLDTSSADLIQDFFVPALARAIRYDRGVGFFSAGWLRVAAEGMAGFARNSGRARWVTSPILSEEDWQALRLGEAARDQGFRRAVVTAYNHRCAICGIRMLTLDGHTVVDAAHIIPWSISYNDDPRNGMALCRLCHWTFDEGLVSVSSQYRVITSPQLAAAHNVPGYLLTLADRGIIGPDEQLLWPDLDALSWHRRNVLRKQ